MAFFEKKLDTSKKNLKMLQIFLTYSISEKELNNLYKQRKGLKIFIPTYFNNLCQLFLIYIFESPTELLA
jgi:hypothetical protein